MHLSISFKNTGYSKNTATAKIAAPVFFTFGGNAQRFSSSAFCSSWSEVDTTLLFI